jgi:hypothetical protein
MFSWGGGRFSTFSPSQRASYTSSLTAASAPATLENIPDELYTILLEVFFVICAAQVLEVHRLRRGTDASWTSERVTTDVGALLQPPLNSVPMARRCWALHHRVIVNTASAELADTLDDHVKAAEDVYEHARATIKKL